ncbi:MAG: ABC transporter ATP-binding protein/permease [Firmicutes bacterium]|nr:ABC transporter ATP-binding protein/permease [Bacillota bacterium]
MNVWRQNLGLLRRFWPYLWKRRGILALDLGCALFCAVSQIVLPLIVRRITDSAVEDPASLTLRLILTVGGAYLLLRLVEAAANYFMLTQGHYMGARIETDMRNDLFGHMQGLSFSYYDNTKVGQLMSRLTTDLFDVTEFAHHTPENILLAAVKLTACMILFARMNLWLALAVTVLTPVMFLVTSRARKRMKEAFRQQRSQIGEINAMAEDSLLGIRVVKSFANEETENIKFRKGNARFFRVKKRGYQYMAQRSFINCVCDGLMYLAAVCIGAWLLRERRITVGDFSMVLLLVSTLLSSIKQMIDFSEQFNRGVTGLERFAEVMDELTETEKADGAVELDHVRGEIAFRDVSFTYPGTERPVLNGFSLTIPPGESVALVGPSGGGKTTLCNLVPRFYDACEGAIAIDGHDVRDLTLQSLRRNIGVVQQDVYLFSGSVRENIAYGMAEATQEEIRRAAKLAGADEFIQKLPEGYDTYVGERGVKLSGGQKQRVSIARVFLRNPPILILDEATSSLDNESERLVQESLERLAKGRTTITIAHRLTTIQNAGQIVVLTEDGVAERGNHADLLKAEGLYAYMWNR